MIILDTDHLSVLEFPENPQSVRLTEAMEQRGDEEFAQPQFRSKSKCEVG
jgi:hypothetical protein